MPQAPSWDLERYRPLLRVLLRQVQLDPRLQRRFDASDLIQEAFLRAVQNLPGFRGTTEAELVKWLEQILATAVADAFRREHAQKRDVALEQNLANAFSESSARLERYLCDGQSSPSQQAARQEEFLRLAEALEGLPEDERDAIIHRHLMGLPIEEIAARLGRTPKAVAGLLYRAQRRLRGLLARET
jgi:RNA polymerase sigma-70 factor (ECF subfamily)